MKYVLSIWWGYCSGAALFKVENKTSDFSVLGAASEERFVKDKNTSAFPLNTIDWLLKKNNITPKDLSKVVYTSQDVGVEYILLNKHRWSVNDYVKENNRYWLPKIYEKQRPNLLEIFSDHLCVNQFPGLEAWKSLGLDIKDITQSDLTQIQDNFNKRVPIFIAEHLGIPQSYIQAIDHHTSHAYYAYSVSSPKLSDLLVFTNDGWGDGRNATVSHLSRVEDKTISLQEITSSTTSVLARVYRYMTLLLGMKPSEHEFKVMGHAAFGKEEYSTNIREVFDNAMRVENGQFIINPQLKDSYKWFREQFEGERFDNIAFGLQAWLEDSLLEWVKYWVEKTGISDIAFAGGVAMNVKAMGILNQQDWIKSISVPPSSGDESHIFGAFYAYLALEKTLITSDAPLFTTTYTGYQSDISELSYIHNLAQDQGYLVKQNPTHDEVASFLADGKILSVCRGKAEFGARALGNRSIMLDPTLIPAKEKLNLSIKNRDFWMPFAPIILDSYSSEYLLSSNKSNSPYMALSFKTSDSGYQNLLSAVHSGDKTCRAQILTQEFNEYIYKVLVSFSSLTGRGGLLNTSFNVHGSPIVNTIEDAYEVFKTTSLDGLLSDQFLIVKD